MPRNKITSQTLILRAQYENTFMGDSPHYFVQLEGEAYKKHLLSWSKENSAYAGLPCAFVQDSDTSPPTWAL